MANLNLIYNDNENKIDLNDYNKAFKYLIENKCYPTAESDCIFRVNNIIPDINFINGFKEVKNETIRQQLSITNYLIDVNFSKKDIYIFNNFIKDNNITTLIEIKTIENINPNFKILIERFKLLQYNTFQLSKYYIKYDKTNKFEIWKNTIYENALKHYIYNRREVVLFETLNTELKNIYEFLNIVINTKYLYRKDVLNFLNFLKNKDIDNNSRNIKLNHVEKFLNFLIVIEDNNCSPEKSHIYKTDYFPKNDNKKEYYISDYTMKMIWENLDIIEEKYRNVIILLIKTGIRIGSALNIKKEDIYIENNNYILFLNTMKGGGTHKIKIDEDLFLFLKNIKVDNNEGFLFFNNITDKVFDLQIINRQLKKLNIFDEYENKINLHCHIFRHKKIDDLIQNDENIVKIKDYMAHKRISTTLNYISNNIEVRKKNILNNVDEIDILEEIKYKYKLFEIDKIIDKIKRINSEK